MQPPSDFYVSSIIHSGVENAALTEGSTAHPAHFWLAAQTYYKLSYVDKRIDSPEQRICEDIPRLADGLGDLLREWCNCSIDAIFYAWALQRYSRTNKYTLAIIGYVLGAGLLTTAASPNFGRLYKRQAENEGVTRRAAGTGCWGFSSAGRVLSHWATLKRLACHRCKSMCLVHRAFANQRMESRAGMSLY